MIGNNVIFELFVQIYNNNIGGRMPPMEIQEETSRFER